MIIEAFKVIKVTGCSCRHCNKYIGSQNNELKYERAIRVKINDEMEETVCVSCFRKLSNSLLIDSKTTKEMIVCLTRFFNINRKFRFIENDEVKI